MKVKALQTNQITAIFFYGFLFVSYWTIGFYLIGQTSITSDESAYIGAAYSYTQGIGLNQEHPLFFKLINSAIILKYFPNYEIAIPVINLVRGEENIEARLAAFNVGYQMLMMRPDNYHDILYSLRISYLFFNSLFVPFLYIYTFVVRFFSFRVSACLGILYVFSPSFYSHNFLIAFDVLVSVYAFMTIMALMAFLKNLFVSNYRQLFIQLILFTLISFMAINAKFSNLILTPIILTSSLIVIIYLFKTNKKDLAIILLSFSIIVFGIFMITTSLMYDWAFRSLPQQSIFDNLNRYFQGIFFNLSTAGGVREPFWNGQFVSMNSLEYFSKIFWFKENPGLFIVAFLVLIIATRRMKIQRHKLYEFWQNWRHPHNLWQLSLIILGVAYPAIYFALTYRSRFIIGYRYFYPLIIFIYFGIALLTVFIRHKWQQYVVIGSLSLYVYLGILGIPQSLSYVNPLWTQEKWQLTDDSTINWGQETQHGVEYLLTHHLLPETNNKIITHQTFGVNINFTQYLDILSQQQDYPLDIQSYYAHSPFHATQSDITKLSEKYLLIDSTVKQQIAANAHNNPIAAKNLELLENNSPIYSRNDIIFLYQLR